MLQKKLGTALGNLVTTLLIKQGEHPKIAIETSSMSDSVGQVVPVLRRYWYVGGSGMQPAGVDHKN